MTISRSSLAVRIGVALSLAALIHLSAWQALLGIRVSLAGPEPAAPTIEAALLPPVQRAVALPGRRAVVRAAHPAAASVKPAEAATLAAVATDARRQSAADVLATPPASASAPAQTVAPPPLAQSPSLA